MSKRIFRRALLLVLFAGVLCLSAFTFFNYSFKDSQQMELWFADNEVSAVAISPNQSYIAAGDIKGNIMIWQRYGDSIYQGWRISEVEITEVRFYVDEHTIITKTTDGATQMWNTESHTLIRTFGLADSKSASTLESSKDFKKILLGGKHALDISSDNRMIAIGKAQGIVELFDVQTGTLMYRLQGHSIVGYPGRYVPVAQVAFDAQSQHFVSFGDDGSIAIWDVKSGNSITNFPENYNFSPPRKILFSSNGQTVIILGGSFMKYQSLDTMTDKIYFTGTIPANNSAAISFFLDTETYARSGENRSGLSYVFPWSGSTVDTNIYIERLHPDQPVSIRILKGHTAWITSLASTKDNNLLVSGSYDRTVRLWSMPK